MRGLLVLAAVVTTVPVASSAASGAEALTPPLSIRRTYVAGRDNLSSFCHNITHNTAINAIGARRLSARYTYITFTWATEAEFAASAVLGLACRCAGIPRVAIASRTYRVTSHFRNDVWLSTLDRGAFPIPLGMEKVSRGVVPVWPRLHVRLAPDAREETRCLRAFNNTSFYIDLEILRNCSLLTRLNNTTTYIPTEWSTVADRDDLLPNLFLDTLNKHNITSQEFMSRVELEKLILHERNESFLFVDAALWEGVEGVWPVKDYRVRQGYNFDVQMRLVSSTLHNAAPCLLDVIRSFTINTSDIREILAFNMSDPLPAASTWVLQRPENRHRLLEWIRRSTKPTPLYMDVLLCDDFNTTDYNFLFHVLCDKMASLTINMNYIRTNLENFYINCSSEQIWPNIILSKRDLLTSYQSIRMVISGDGVFEIVENDEKYFKKPVLALATSGPRPVFPLGGTPEALVQGLLQFLYNCSIRRIAVISEKSDIANNVTAALHRLHDRRTLTYRYEQLWGTSETMITDILNSLGNYDNARIFLVNGDTRLANKIIRMAKSMQLTPERGYLWIVREWEGPGDETMQPYEVTFSYRGGDNVASVELGDLERLLNNRWRNSTWPRHAASVANAALAVNIALTQLTVADPDVVYNLYSHTTYRTLLEYSGSFPSMVGEHRIEKQVVKNPRMFVYQWGGEYPTLVAGGAGHAGAGCPLSVPHDGSIACITSSDGDAFPPKCNDRMWLIVGIATITFVLILTMATIACCRALRARDKRLIEEAENMGRARLDAFTSSLAPYFVERKALKLQHQIGAGRFGLVWFGMLQEPTDDTRPVAAKALHEGAVAEGQSEFFREARNLAVLQHDHVIRFVGVCVADGPPLLLMEHAFFGDLSQYLSNRRHLVESTETDSTETQYVSAAALTRYTRDAAAALAFIVRRGFVHRDVRAVNCLVDERRMVKLADFGMAREMSGSGNKHDGEYWCRRRALFPVLWMAPESLSRGVFSTASDVWSLGVLALEVSTLGARPYGGRSPLTVVELVVAGGRPPLPRDISAAARELLLRCWQRAPADRPTAADVVTWLEQNPLALAPALGNTRTVL